LWGFAQAQLQYQACQFLAHMMVAANPCPFLSEGYRLPMKAPLIPFIA